MKIFIKLGNIPKWKQSTKTILFEIPMLVSSNSSAAKTRWILSGNCHHRIASAALELLPTLSYRGKCERSGLMAAIRV